MPEAAMVCPKRGQGGKHPDHWLDDPTWQGSPASAPRICSYCGGRHPDEVIAILTTQKQMQLVGAGNVRHLGEKDTRINSAKPGVRVYMNHFSAAQLKKLGITKNW